MKCISHAVVLGSIKQYSQGTQFRCTRYKCITSSSTPFSYWPSASWFTYVNSQALGSSMWRGLMNSHLHRHNALQDSSLFRHRYASEVWRPSLCLCESNVAPCSDAPTTLWDNTGSIDLVRWHWVWNKYQGHLVYSRPLNIHFVSHPVPSEYECLMALE